MTAPVVISLMSALVFVQASPIFDVIMSLVEKGKLYSILRRDGIFPDVIDILPSYVAKEQFRENNVLVEARLGNEVLPEEVRNVPTVLEWPGDGYSYYTVIVIGPDVPSRQDPKLGPFLIYLVSNIRGNDLSSGGNVYAEYSGSYPPKNTGFHRYLFLVYLQKSPLQLRQKFIPARCFENRTRFSVKYFAETYDLIGPIAINYFRTQNDKFVEDFYANQQKTEKSKPNCD